MMAFGRKKQPNAQDSKRPSVIEERDANKPAPPEQAPALGEPKISENNVAIVEYKFGIANRLTESVASKVVSLQKRSPDLVPLSKEFEGMRKGLRQMISSAKKFQESMIEMDKNRLQMVTDMAQFAQSTPLSDRVASLDQPQSLMTVYQAASKDVGAASSLFQNEILDYCIEWESVVSTRVDKEMIATNKLREHYNHYQTKVEGMRKKVNGQEAKGKDIAETVTEKLQRNEQKLVEASADFEGAAAPLCVLIEEVVQEGWKDLYPLIQAAMKWEVDRSQKEARTFQRLQPGELETAFFKVTGQPFQSGTGATSAKKVPPKKVQRESV